MPGLALALALALALIAQPGMSQPTPRPAGDAAEIRALWDRATTALCGGDWERYRELWAHAEHIEVIHPEQRDWRVGWEEIGPAYRALLGTGFRCEAETRSMRIHLSPAREMAWATAEVAIRTGEPAEERTLWQSLVFEKLEGRWRLVHAHASAPPPAPE